MSNQRCKSWHLVDVPYSQTSMPAGDQYHPVCNCHDRRTPHGQRTAQNTACPVIKLLDDLSMLITNLDFAVHVVRLSDDGPLSKGLLVHAHVIWFDLRELLRWWHQVCRSVPEWRLQQRLVQEKARMDQCVIANHGTLRHVATLSVPVVMHFTDYEASVSAAHKAAANCLAKCLDIIINWIHEPRVRQDDGTIVATNIERARVQWQTAANEISRITPGYPAAVAELSQEISDIRDETIRLCKLIMPEGAPPVDIAIAEHRQDVAHASCQVDL
ncbi:hypothetical protein Daus18300_009815 [Diaporthe australafricana]|uniref:Uncharacterized protein n=1 Tax=Diaporthe australafricana TaxID=127596 RepID=A0ABR3WCS2_9PEZI